MKMFRPRLLALLACFGAVAGANGALPYLSRSERPWTTDRIMVKWRDGSPPVRFHFPVIGTHTQGAMSILRLPRGAQMSAALAELRADPRVLRAEPNVRRRILTLNPPNEPGWTATDPQPDYTTRTYGESIAAADQKTYMWALQKINALDAWRDYPGTYYMSATKPANPVKIAVIDTGCDLAHPDWLNVGGSSANAAQGGQLDLADAVSFLGGTGQAQPLTDDQVGHGTFTAGIVGAAANNGGTVNPVGGAIGIAYAAQVMPIQVLNDASTGSVDDEISGIYWAVDHGAQVISLSLGDYTYSSFEQDAVDYAWQHNVLVVAAAGNDGGADALGNPGQNRPLYPACDNHVLAVGATDHYDTPASYSNHGQYLGIAAPGGDLDPNVTVPIYGVLDVPVQFTVWSCMPTHPFQLQVQSDGMGGTINDYLHENYDYAPGTSAACPFVAGLAGLYAQKFGITRNTPNAAATLYQALQRSAVNTQAVANGGWSEYGGFGRIDAAKTLGNVDTRNATVGCIVGKVTTNANAETGIRITATMGTVTKSVNTRSPDGGFRIANLAPGQWAVTASTTTSIGTVVVTVRPGVDNFGADFNFPWPYGDIDHNGIVDMRDAVEAARMIAGTDPMDPYGQQRLDIYPWAGVGGPLHGDGTLDYRDVAQIMRIAAGLRLL
ncbi:MAG TPA: S8 family serine peptidase [Armatimonadota bacterium]|jgi:hypothetical protein